MGSGSRHNNRRTRKGKSLAVKYTTTPTNEDGSSSSNSASAKKISLLTPAEDAPVTVSNDCNVIINSDFFVSLILMIGHCPGCTASINIEHLIQQKMGLAQFFGLSCVEYKWHINKEMFCTSKECC